MTPSNSQSPPWLTTRECGDYLGVSATFIREEIQDGRLDARIIERPVLPGRRRSKKIYRVTVDALRAYCARWCKHALANLPPSS